jgi:PAS domain S-box-containing protein
MRITSMLDAVIRTSGRNLGALCFEHVDRPHHWEQDEVAFACQLADQIALAILNRDSALAGEALRESEERFRTIFDSAKDAIFLETPEGRILDANKAACELLGYTREELLAKRVSDIVPPERAALFPKRIQARTVQKGVYVEVEELRKKGVRIPVEVSNTLVDIGGRQRVVAIVRDIGERKRLEEQLLHAQKMEAVGTLAGGLAHDFNNILAGILGYASLLRALLNENNLPSSDAESIEGLTQRGAAIARSLLAFSRKGAYRPVALSINEVVGSVLQMMAQTAGKQIEIRTKLPEGVSSVIGDEGQLHQALLNLCINACEAMPDGGTLTVETANAKPGRGFFLAHPKTTQGPYVSVAVADTGIGMDAETRARIFEPFFTTKADTTGTGLGLPMALGIVERHGGCIEVESASGEGSRFTMYLPATRRKAREVRRKPVGTLRGDETILVVDDEDGFRDGTSRWLRELGYTVIEAASGAEALRIIRKKKDKIKLVLLDMIMKGPSGTETFARMRKLSPGTAVVICTGYSIDAKCQRALRSGASGIILKPLEADRIALKIRQILDDR